MNNTLPRCSPESVGISSLDTENCIRSLSHELTTMNGFMAARYGKVFAECWWAPFTAQMPHSNHSFGKSYTATAIGIAIGEGLLRADEKMTDIFAEEIAEKHLTIPAGLEKITIEHVLTMTNGMARHPDMTGDFIAHYLTTPMACEPGTRFHYNSAGSCMLGAVIAKRTGQNLKEYLTPRLFEKIGIDPEHFVWRKFRENGIDAEPGTFARTEDNLRLAMLYCMGGKWNGEQVVPEEFIRSALSVHISTADAPEQKDGKCGYGYQLWACSIPGVYRFDGGQGQFGIIWPEKQLVIALHEGGLGQEGAQKTLDVLYSHLLNHLHDEPLPENAAALASLRRTEKEVCLPDDPVSGPADDSFSGSFRITEGCFDPWLSASPPGNGDLFTMFRNPDKDVPIKRFRIRIGENECRIRLDNGAELIAAQDGILRAHFTDSPFDRLGDYAATAAFPEPGKLRVHFHWLNGWFETIVEFEKAADGLTFTTYKLWLNAEDNYLIFRGRAVRDTGGEQ